MVNRRGESSGAVRSKTLGKAPRIAALPAELVNQIAAGEVIERPASVVKELVENAIDAGAQRIRVEIEDGGRRSISVADDGVGIHPDDLELAVLSHATSKLRSQNDLFTVATLGFRGEALASIASVCRLEIFSRCEEESVGARLVSHQGRLEWLPPQARARGTRITAQGLFDAIPARKKFLKSERAEFLRIKTVLAEIGLSEPSVGLSLVSGGRTAFEWESGQNEHDRIVEVLGARVRGQLLEVGPESGSHPSVHGWIGPPDLYRRTSEAIHWILNGRPIRDTTLLSALREAYRGFQIPGRYPVAVIYLEIDPREFDVNVHPTKREIRFRDSRALFSLVHRAVKSRLEAAGSVPTRLPDTRWDAERTIGRAAEGPTSVDPSARRIGAGNSDTSTPGAGNSGTGTSGAGNSGTGTSGTGTSGSTPAFESSAVDPALAPEGSPGQEVVREGPSSYRAAPASALNLGRLETRYWQVGSRYLLLEETDGVRFIDQHALHEKIIYEELLEEQQAGSLSQPLRSWPSVGHAPRDPARSPRGTCWPAGGQG